MKPKIPMFISKDVPLEPVLEKAMETDSQIFLIENQRNMAETILKYLEEEK